MGVPSRFFLSPMQATKACMGHPEFRCFAPVVFGLVQTQVNAQKQRVNPGHPILPGYPILHGPPDAGATKSTTPLKPTEGLNGAPSTS
jgi:hypothetical protein